jgi:uncharacterized membrane protein YhaH (DUF805 family)
MHPFDLVLIPMLLLPLVPGAIIVVRRFRATGTRAARVRYGGGTGNDDPPWWAWVLLMLAFLASLWSVTGGVP